MTALPSLTADLKTLSDETIVARVRAGESGLFELIMRRHNARLYRVARSFVGDAEAEDVMQESYVRAFNALDRFEGRSKLSTWLTRIVIHEALSRLRKRRRHPEVPMILDDDGAVAPPADGPEQPVVAQELRGALEEALDALPPPYRLAFVLREVEGLSTREAAACMKVSEEALRVRLHRAKLALRMGIEARLGAAAKQLYDFEARRCNRVVAAVLERVLPPRAS